MRKRAKSERDRTAHEAGRFERPQKKAARDGSRAHEAQAHTKPSIGGGRVGGQHEEISKMRELQRMPASVSE